MPYRNSCIRTADGVDPKLPGVGGNRGGILGVGNWDGCETYLGVFFLICGVSLTMVSIGFLGLVAWTYLIMKQLVAGPLGLRGAHLFGLDRKIKSAEVRRAFGLAPLNESTQSKL